MITCQDTAAKGGKPGKREQVESACREALRRGCSVVVDRMHLSPEQRAYFLAIGKECGVPTDAVLLLPSLAEMTKRVRERTGHPGGVQGESGAAYVSGSYKKVVPPEHAEGFELVSRCVTPADVARLTDMYKRIITPPSTGPDVTANAADGGALSHASLPPCGWPAARDVAPTATPLPSVVLGTMELTGDKLRRMLLDGGFAGVDCAPTYKNERGVGESLPTRLHLTCKVPLRAPTAAGVRSELQKSLADHRRDKCQLLLLHWPNVVIENGTLEEVWRAMEAAVDAGEAEALGVCNFSVAALRHLLSLRPKVLPCVNQVERHPRCPQWELIEYCAAQRIVVQAHSPFAHGHEWLMRHAIVVKVASEARMTPAQVLIQWNLRHHVVVAPKCSTESHARDILEAASGASPMLTPSQMKWLDSITPPGAKMRRCVNPPYMWKPGPQGRHYGWDKSDNS